MRRHRWKGTSTCEYCGLHREGAGYGPYGSMRYYRDSGDAWLGSPGQCPQPRCLECFRLTVANGSKTTCAGCVVLALRA